MTRARVTSTQVAQLAGVSRSAVSRVFTPGASASPATVEKVRQAAADLGYRPNTLARAMVSGRSRIIGLVVAYLDNQFYPDALERLSTSLQAKGYHVLVFMTSRTQGDVDQIVAELLDYQVDGIIAASVSIGSALSERCQSAGVPVVFFNRSTDDASFSSVTSENLKGGQQVAEYFSKSGFERMGYIAGWQGASTQRDRELGFRQGLADAGLTLSSHAIGNFRTDFAQAATREMFDRTDHPEAVFVANDHMAFAVMDVLRFELGMRVPQDVAVVGFDDVQMAAWPSYNLTTVRQHAGQMVEKTVDILMNRIEKGVVEPRSETVEVTLIPRGSAPRPNNWSS